MTNLECVIAALAAHREARQWDDAVVAADLVAQLGLNPDGNAAKAKPHNMPGITEAEVVAHEAAAKEAALKAEAARAALKAQSAEMADVAPPPMLPVSPPMPGQGVDYRLTTAPVPPGGAPRV